MHQNDEATQQEDEQFNSVPSSVHTATQSSVWTQWLQKSHSFQKHLDKFIKKEKKNFFLNARVIETVFPVSYKATVLTWLNAFY